MILNMFIAIMGDTFEKTIENKNLNNVRAKLQLMGEQSNNIFTLKCRFRDNKSEINDALDQRNFLYVITPDVTDLDELDSDSWEGSIK